MEDTVCKNRKELKDKANERLKQRNANLGQLTKHEKFSFSSSLHDFSLVFKSYGTIV